jgi:prepilin peptidase CpaA
MASTLLHLSALAFFPALMALSASMDLLTFTIPNRLCAVLLLGYLVFAVLLGVPAVDILLNISCALAILIVAFVMFNLGWVGGGDAKLAAATAAWLGWTAILDYGVAAAIFGGILTLIILGAHGAPARRLWPHRLACPIAQCQRGCTVWNCVGSGGADGISQLIHLGGDRLSEPSTDRLRSGTARPRSLTGAIHRPNAAAPWSDRRASGAPSFRRWSTSVPHLSRPALGRSDWPRPRQSIRLGHSLVDGQYLS